MAGGRSGGIPRQGPRRHRRADKLTIPLAADRARRLRLRAQGLDAKRTASVAEVAAGCGGIQAQDAVAESLAVRARADGLTSSDVRDARAVRRSVVRTWAMRGTMHLVDSEDAGWLLQLLGPTMIRKSRSRHRELGITDKIGERAVAAMQDMLGRNGPMSRAAIALRLAPMGIPVEGQAIHHLVRLAALEGVVCFGPDNGGEKTYDLLRRWPAADRAVDDPQAELARRYLRAYGPAGPEDMAAWSGLPLKTARAAFDRIDGELIEVVIGGSPSWMLESRAHWLDDTPSDALAVRLLPAFDTYLLGYKDRDLGAPAEYARRIHPGGGIIRPALMVDGRALGTWMRNRRGQRLAITVKAFRDLPAEIIPALEDEAADIGRFLGMPAALSVVPGSI